MVGLIYMLEIVGSSKSQVTLSTSHISISRVSFLWLYDMREFIYKRGRESHESWQQHTLLKFFMQGLNVYSILQHDTLIMSVDAIWHIEIHMHIDIHNHYKSPWSIRKNALREQKPHHQITIINIFMWSHWVQANKNDIFYPCHCISIYSIVSSS